MEFSTATFYTNAENFKSGKHFNLEHLIKISKILDVPIVDFFESQTMTNT
jgi:putative transcriptional regulator